MLSALLLATLVVGVAGGAPSTDGDVAAARTAPLAPRSGALFGTWMDRDGATPEAREHMLLTREAQIGRRFDVVNRFRPFTSAFPGDAEARDVELGRIPMVSWNGTDAAEIAEGRHDAVIRRRADDVATFGHPVFLRFFWEMDRKDKQALSRSPEHYVAAWQRVRATFADAGATNAVWVWCPTSWAFEQGDAARWYPGDDAVDWICADGYNWAPTLEHARWRSWGSIYDDAHRFAVAHHKPLMAGEWGALEREPGEKAAWYEDARRTIRTAMPNLAAVVAFDERRWRADLGTWFDWEVDSSESTLRALQQWGRDPYFRTRGPLLLPTVEVGDTTVAEPAAATATVGLPLTLSAPAPAPIAVTITTRPITATEGADYTAASTTVTFAPGSTGADATITVRADATAEPTESFELTVSETAGGATIGRATGTVTILDPGPGRGAVRIAAMDGSVHEGGAGARDVGIAIRALDPLRAPVTVSWTLVATGATPGADWTARRSGTVTLQPGRAVREVGVTVLADWLPEGPETLTLRLDRPEGAIVVDPIGVLTIVDDDVP